MARSAKVVGKAIARNTRSKGSGGDAVLPLLERKKKKKKGSQLFVTSPSVRPAATTTSVPSLVASPIQLQTTKKKKKLVSVVQVKRPIEDVVIPSKAAISKRPRADVSAEQTPNPTSFDDAVRFMQKHVKASDSSSESDSERKPRLAGRRTFPPQAPGSDEDLPQQQSTNLETKSATAKHNTVTTPGGIPPNHSIPLDRRMPPRPGTRDASSNTGQDVKHTAKLPRATYADVDEFKLGSVVGTSKKLKKAKRALTTSTPHLHVNDTALEPRRVHQEKRKTKAVPLTLTSSKQLPEHLSGESDGADAATKTRMKPAPVKVKDGEIRSNQSSTSSHHDSLNALLLKKIPLGSMDDSSDSDSQPATRTTFSLPQDAASDDDDDDDVVKAKVASSQALTNSKSGVSTRSKQMNASTVKTDTTHQRTSTKPDARTARHPAKLKTSAASTQSNPSAAHTRTAGREDDTSDSEQEAVFEVHEKSQSGGRASSGSKATTNSVASKVFPKTNLAQKRVRQLESESPSIEKKSSLKAATKPTDVAELPSKKRKMPKTTTPVGATMLEDAVKVMQKQLNQLNESPPTPQIDPMPTLSKAGKMTFMNGLIDAAAVDQWNLVDMGRLVRLICHQWRFKRKKTVRFLEQNCPEFVCAEFLDGLNVPLKVDQIVKLLRHGSSSLAVLSTKLSACIESDMVRLTDDTFLASIADIVDFATMSQDEIADFVTPLIESANYMDDACKLLHRVCEHWPMDAMQAFVQRVLLLNPVFDDLEGDPADMSKYFPNCAFDLPNRMLRDMEDMDENGNLKGFCAGEGDDDIEYEERSSADELEALDDMIDKFSPAKRTRKVATSSLKAVETEPVTSEDDDDNDSDDDISVIDDEEEEVQQWHQGPKSSAFRRKRSKFILDEASEEEDYESSDEGGDETEENDELDGQEEGDRKRDGRYTDDDPSEHDDFPMEGDQDDDMEDEESVDNDAAQEVHSNDAMSMDDGNEEEHDGPNDDTDAETMGKQSLKAMQKSTWTIKATRMRPETSTKRTTTTSRSFVFSCPV
ncbi:hypothetical protein H310_06441 [Aphanomyces invadans]|uniref:Uncharacterized protein n=1 Tax=Aphanomyces invadans TaxID=157072 RepID=A0A024U6J5_9STRA|nr:hypothetical protein H310_06441 [Aphanomyces invadans]ETW01879.1 hypothetical protein H310_06441 [Aphanomyces invadans]|eukprot:XP_008869727.1 hypothetical protein H310_06441 [Aphanomyces invadans]